MTDEKMELTAMHDYQKWIANIKKKIRKSQIKASVQVNQEMLLLYWDLGKGIVEKQKLAKWGDKLISQLSKDLNKAFPDVQGFSRRNLELMRKWYLYYAEYVEQEIIAKQVVSQMKEFIIFNIPWGHNVRIVAKSATLEEAVFYANETLEYGWSRAVLVHQIESGLFARKGRATTNFKRTLPEETSDLAAQSLKNPYNFDFLSMTENYNERELENALISQITQFLLELGTGFAYVGKQYELHVGNSDFVLDLLFYHIKLKCYVVVELKTTKFEPSYTGQLKFYMTAINKQIKDENDNPTIGILICKHKDEVVAEYALEDITQPMGITEYRLGKALTDAVKSSLPSIASIESEIKKIEET